VNLTLIFSGFTCKINDEILGNMTSEIRKSSCWQSITLVFYENILSDEGLKNLAFTMKEKRKLHTLNLSFYWGNGKITDEGVKLLASSFNDLENLSNLTLAFSWVHNSLTDKAPEYIVANLEKNRLLENLTLEIAGGKDKNLNNDGLKNMCKYLSALKFIKSINLSFSKYKFNFNRDLADHFFNSLKNLSDLRRLSIEIPSKMPKEFAQALKDKLSKVNPQCDLVFKERPN